MSEAKTVLLLLSLGKQAAPSQGTPPPGGPSKGPLGRATPEGPQQTANLGTATWGD